MDEGVVEAKGPARSPLTRGRVSHSEPCTLSTQCEMASEALVRWARMGLQFGARREPVVCSTLERGFQRAGLLLCARLSGTWQGCRSGALTAGTLSLSDKLSLSELLSDQLTCSCGDTSAGTACRLAGQAQHTPATHRCRDPRIFRGGA